MNNPSLIGRLLIIFIRKYQQVASDRIRKSCKFEPTCSNYAISAIEEYGASRGTWLTIKRLSRCRPPNGGHDPII